jgi:hypothetical protein
MHMAKHTPNRSGHRGDSLPKTPTKRLTVKEAAQKALHQYAGTFRDLARYDRGEQSINPVSH